VRGEPGLLGVPSSAAAHGPGQEKARPHNLRAVLGVLRETSRRVGEVLADGRVPLVLAASARSPSPSCPPSGTGAPRRRWPG
jgi:hypothetical protein